MAILTPTGEGLTRSALYNLLEKGRQQAIVRRRPTLVSIGEQLPSRDPLLVFAAHIGEQRAYWEHRDADRSDSIAMVGVGTALTIVAKGAQRFAHAERAWRDLLDGALIEDAAQRWGSGPLLMGGFSFDPQRPRTQVWADFPDGMLLLPRLTLATTDAGSLLTLNCVIAPESDATKEAATLMALRGRILQYTGAQETPVAGGRRDTALIDVLPPEQWQALVARTAGEIREGRYAKVVLARQGQLELDATPATLVAQALRRLRDAYPGSFLFAITTPAAGGDESIFLGATPERLVRLEQGSVKTAVLAGSAPRGITPEEDRQLGQALLASAKDRHEHAVVATMLRWSLAPVCRRLDAPETPTLLRLRNVQHLFTPVRGLLNGAHSILELVGRVHPTPAVGGFPRQAALQAIREREDLDRGWYAAPIGWLDQHGQGEFAVAIRSALLRPQTPPGARAAQSSRALLFAGCGIMGDSDPAREYAESSIKMQAMLTALAG